MGAHPTTTGIITLWDVWLRYFKTHKFKESELKTVGWWETIELGTVRKEKRSHGSEIAAEILHVETFCALRSLWSHVGSQRDTCPDEGQLIWVVCKLYLGPVCDRGSSWPAPPPAPGGPVPACTTGEGWGYSRHAAWLWDSHTAWNTHTQLVV